MNFKKLFPIIICITMLLSIMVSADGILDPFPDNPEISDTCGKNLKWEINEDTLTISGAGDIWNFRNQSLPPWHPYRESIKNIRIESGVTRIGDNAFEGFSNLVSVTMPNSIKYIGFASFSGCSSLTEIIIPDGVEIIGYDSMPSYWWGTFQGCSNLKSITIPNSVTNIGSEAFYCCDNLTDVYYKGTEAEWKNISIQTFYNESLINATIHFLPSETTPDTTAPVTTAPVTTAPVTNMPVEDTEEIKDTTKDDSALSAESKKDTSDENASVSTSDDTSDSEGTSTGIIVAAAAGTIALAGGAGAFIFFKKYK